jgi:hypothetical protein
MQQAAGGRQCMGQAVSLEALVSSPWLWCSTASFIASSTHAGLWDTFGPGAGRGRGQYGWRCNARELCWT